VYAARNLRSLLEISTLAGFGFRDVWMRSGDLGDDRVELDGVLREARRARGAE
jgi:hypothetical protein